MPPCARSTCTTGVCRRLADWSRRSLVTQMSKPPTSRASEDDTAPRSLQRRLGLLIERPRLDRIQNALLGLVLRATGGLLHLLAQTQWAHIRPDLINVREALRLRAFLADLTPPGRRFTVGEPDRVLFLVIDDHLVDSVVLVIFGHSQFSSLRQRNDCMICGLAALYKTKAGATGGDMAGEKRWAAINLALPRFGGTGY